jgi:diguanylate cyclase (GGDEF)-like protein/PAS domain S-box-containing protein
MYDKASGQLLPTNVWHRPDPAIYEPLIEATASLVLAPDEGVPGRALLSRHPEWVADVTSDADFRRVAAAKEAAIHAGVAVPVLVNGGVGAVLEFFSPDELSPDPELLAVLDYVGFAWSRVLEFEHLATELTHSEERFHALVESAVDAVIVADEDGCIVSWNPAATRVFGYSPDEMLGEPLTVLMPERYRPRHLAAFERARARDPSETGGQVLEFEGLTKDGRVFPLELSLTSWHGDRRYFAGIMRDITERRAAEEELRLLGSAAAHVQDAIIVSTAGSHGGPTILYVNSAFVQMTGYSEAEALGRSFSLLAGPKTDRDVLGRIHQRMRKGEQAAAELVAYRKDRSEFLLDWHASPIYEPDRTVRHYASIQRDITEERRVEQALKRADRDPLTGLATREVLERRVSRAIERAESRGDYRYAVLFMDLDGFKAVNDAHGHMVGDQLLTAAARRLEGTVRPGDTLARFGGDEFVVLLDSVTDIQDVLLVASRIRSRLGANFEVSSRQLGLAVSIGVALSETGYSDPKDAIRDADAAMYEAKRKGKSRVEFFDSSLYAEIVSIMSLREDLARCLERDELELRYQPLVDLTTQEIIGFEALLRWRHPELGLLQPEKFIPLAEETGLIVPMGRWVLRNACAAAIDWPTMADGRRKLALSVNLSMRELASPDLVDAVAEALDATGLEAERLQLELTESVLVDSIEPVRSRIGELRGLGITVCIDDFGTGYSSLGYLHHFPVDKIKIDRLFVRDLGETSGKLEILRAILSLASKLGVGVVAEGIETEGQLVRLQDLACGFGQGFLFAEPLEAGQLEELLRSKSTRAG